MPLVLRSLVVALSVAIVGCSGSSNSNNNNPPPLEQNPPKAVNLTLLGRYSSGQFGVGAANGVAWYGGNKVALVVNQQANRVEVISLSTPATPAMTATIDASAAAATALNRAMGKVAAVAVYDDPIATNDRDRIAVTVMGATFADKGAIVVYKAADRSVLKVFETGVGPKAVTFNPGGRFIISANEGAPAPDYSVDPLGSIGVVDLEPAIIAPATTAVPVITLLDFTAFNRTGITPIPEGSREAEIAPDVRFSRRPNVEVQSTRAQDFEPEAVSSAVNDRAYVSLQENNAMATVALNPARIETIVGFGSKDFNTATSSMDASDQDGATALTARPVRGFRQPGGLFAYRNADEVLVLTANTGAPRQLPGFDETTRAATLNLDPVVFPNAASLQQNNQLGRLVVSATEGNAPAVDMVPQDPDFESIFTYGARSFSLVRTTGFPIYDSGNDFERITLERLGANFNSAADANGTGDTRSDDQGPAPKAVTMGQIDGATFAFVGLSEVGGVMVYALDAALRVPRFLQYVNERNFNVSTSLPDANGDGVLETNPAVGDLGPTQMIFVPLSTSPTTDSLLLVANGISGTTTVYAVRPVAVP